MRIIAFASGKGGVGKTTIVANLGLALARQGKKVLMVDTDLAMANLSLVLGMETSPITLNDVLKGDAGVWDIIYDGPEKINIMPASLGLQDTQRLDLGKLPNIIKQVAPKYDFVLLDCPAGIGEDTLASMASSTEVFLVVNPHSLSIADALKTKMAALRINAKPVGLIINMYAGLKGEIPEKDIISMLEIPLYGVVPYDEEVRKTFYYKKIQPVIMRNPNAEASKAIVGVAGKILGIEISMKRESKGFFAWIKSLFSKKSEE
jgi:septum site-determining protein MinD